mgnify:CR=1 FL=1
MLQFIGIGKTLLSFSSTYRKMILADRIVGSIVYIIYSQKLDIAELTADLVQTQQQLENVKEQYATQTELNKVRNEISTANQEVIERVNDQNRRVSSSLNQIESQIAQNGSDVDKLRMQLHPDVADYIDQEIKERGYNEK